MAKFSAEGFAQKLRDLNASQQSIQTLSLWLIHHRKHSKSIVEIWLKELRTVTAERKLNFIWLANDVVQNSKKKGPEYGRDFKTVIVHAFRHVYKNTPQSIHKSLHRLHGIWKERGIFDKVTSAALKKALEGSDENVEPGSGGTSASNSRSNTPDTQANTMVDQMKRALKGSKKETKRKEKHKSKSSTASPVPTKKKKKQEPSLLEEIEKEMEETGDTKPPEAEDLVKSLEDLENSASSDANVREKIAALPSDVSDITLLDKIETRTERERLSTDVEEACDLLNDYNSRLSEELADRRGVAMMLRNFISAQKESLTGAEKQLAEHKARLSQVASIRKELKVHMSSLPDMNLLPNVTALAPLPSAGDLFALGADS